MFKILDNLAVHGFEGKARVSNVDMKPEDLESGTLFSKDIEIFHIVDVRQLKDGEPNPLALYVTLIEKVNDLLNSGKKVVVCCEAGQSRSPAIALGVLLKRGYDFYGACSIISETVPPAQIDLGHMDALRKIFGVKLY